MGTFNLKWESSNPHAFSKGVHISLSESTHALELYFFKGWAYVSMYVYAHN